jgi:galactokinase/mevalonate kinase-like predicted kinase
MRPTQYLLSVPPGMVPLLGELEGRHAPDWFAADDPPGQKLGSGGGMLHLLVSAWRESGARTPFDEWLQAAETHRVVILGGGESRRLPAYAPAGKLFTPMPVWRWAVGQRLGQTLLDLQLPLLRRARDQAAGRFAVTVASGDVLLRIPGELPPFPEVDVLLLGLWVTPEVARSFGVAFCPRQRPQELSFLLQKPEPARIRELSRDYLFLVDTGVWLLSARAIAVLLRRAGCDPRRPARVGPYELYASFGPALGSDPSAPDPQVTGLTAAVLPVPGGEFYHFGTSRDLARSYARLQNVVLDQRAGSAPYRKPHPDVFLQNAQMEVTLGPQHREIWIENAHLPAGWSLTREHVITGVPPNDWALALEPGVCLDVVPLAEGHCLRPYGIDDDFRGPLRGTRWLGRPALEWFERRGLAPEDPEADIQQARLYPVLSRDALSGAFVSWLCSGSPARDPEQAARWAGAPRLSAADLTRQADLRRLYAQRGALRRQAIPALFANHRQSVFFALDLADTGRELAASDQPLPPPIEGTEPLKRVHDQMFRATVMRHRRQPDWADEERRAFDHLRESMLAPFVAAPVIPRLALIEDQIVWGRSPVRLDLAGGWTDTPPYCLEAGGCVLNVAVDLNGQPPIQVFVRHRPGPEIIVRSIDLGVDETLTSYEQIGQWARVGDAFSIVKAALALCGFHPRFQGPAPHRSLRAQLEAAGGGLELSLLAAVPKGSGLGTSSILAATVLGTLGEVCGLGWSAHDLIPRTLVLEQLLTTGGGWQDQAGGVLPSIKLVETEPGLDQTPTVRWLPDRLLAAPHANDTILLYYTGITRVAKGILQEIVRGMFLNASEHLEILGEIGRHARRACDVVQRADWDGLVAAIARSWELNQRLDGGTNPPAVAAILAQVSDWLSAAKLLGAGGGGYMLMFAKDPEAARRIRAALTRDPPNPKARFVTFGVSGAGLQITKS